MEGRREGGKEGRKEGRKAGRMDGRKETLILFKMKQLDTYIEESVGASANERRC